MQYRALFKRHILLVYFRLLLRTKKTARPMEAEAPSRKAVYLPLLDHYPGLGLLYCIWHLERSLPAAFRCVSKKKKISMFRRRLITLFSAPPQHCGRVRFISCRGRKARKKGSCFRFLFVGVEKSQVLATTVCV